MGEKHKIVCVYLCSILLNIFENQLIMRPPICAICRKRFSPRKANGSGLVYFKLSEEEKARNDRMKEKRMKGHPSGREWFCEEHYSIAQKYNHLTRGEAIPEIKNHKEIQD